MNKGVQLLAITIDEQLQKLIIGSLSAALDTFHVGCGQMFQVEIEALVTIIFWMGTYLHNKATPGMKAFHLKFNGKLHALLGVLCLLTLWVFKRLQRFASDNNWRSIRDRVSLFQSYYLLHSHIL